MSRLPLQLRHILLAGLFATTSTAMPANQIFARLDSCTADQISCPSSNPSNFCCPANTVCQALAGGTTALCCPQGRKCDKIQPITCDLSVQDPEKHPEAQIKTNVFNLELPKCGDSACCPFGYTCSNDKECLIDANQDEAPAGANPSATSSVGPTATATETGTATATGTETEAPKSSAALPTVAAPSGTLPANSTEPEPAAEKSSGSGPATTSIIGGVVGSVLILLVISIIIFLYVRRKNRREAMNNEKGGHFYSSGRTNSSTTSSFGNVISDPIMQPNSYRTDFILKTPSSRASTSAPSTAPRRFSFTSPRSQPPRIRISIPNPFESPSPSPAIFPNSTPRDDRPPRTGNVAARLPPIRAMKNSIRYSSRPSAQQDLTREPSSESISVFADPNTMNPKPKTRRLTRGTTFTDLMDEADLSDVRRGSPYVPGGANPYVPGTTPRI